MDNTLHSYILTTEILLNYEQALEYFLTQNKFIIDMILGE